MTGSRATISDLPAMPWLEAVVIGASAGAVDALSAILPVLPLNFPLPILVVVHLPPDRPSAMPQLFASKCALLVKEAEDKELIQRGTIYLAPPNYHLLIESNGELSLSSEPPIFYSRPSIDVLFESAAEAYGRGLVGVILTGANSDGARGLRAICDQGGFGIVEDPHSAQSEAMPRAALAECPVARVMSLADIGPFLRSLGEAIGK